MAKVKQRGNSLERTREIDEAVNVLYAILKPGARLTTREIAYVCGCTNTAIFLVEERARQKLKRRLFMLNDPVLRELCETLFK